MTNDLFSDELTLFERTWLMMRSMVLFARCPDSKMGAGLRGTIKAWTEAWIQYHATANRSDSQADIGLASSWMIDGLDDLTRTLTLISAWEESALSSEELYVRLNRLHGYLRNNPPADPRDPPWEEPNGEQADA